MRKGATYFADFETVTANTQYFKKHQDTRINLFHIKNANCEKVGEGVNLKQFFNVFKKMNYNGVISCYFHNLNFDGDFILKYLAFNDFRALNEPAPREEAPKEYGQPNTFTFLRQGRNIYFIKTWFKNDNNKTINVVFKCSLKILSAGIEALGKGLKIDKYAKNQNRAEFYDVEPMERVEHYPVDFVEYCARDVEIQTLSFERFANNLKNFVKSHWYVKKIDFNKFYTIGSIAYKIQSDFIKHYAYLNKNIEIYEGIKINKKSYLLARKFYAGGITQFNPNYQGKTYNASQVVKIDINSAHPHSMTKLLPYGEMYNMREIKPVKGRKHLIYYEIKVKQATTKGGHFLNLANWNKINNRWNKDNPDYKQKECTNHRYVFYLHDFTCYYLKEEWEELQNFYNFEGVKIVNTYWAYADYFLSDYVKSLYKYKERYSKENDKANAQTYKIMLNSSYGKHGTRVDFAELFVCANKQVYDYLLKNSPVTLKGQKWEVSECNDDIKLNNHYILKMTPLDIDDKPLFNKLIAATICAHTRIYIYQTMYKLGLERFLYCDTDSLVFKKFDGWDNLLELDNYKLGAWALESIRDAFHVRGAKNYATFDATTNNWAFTMSGINGRWVSSNMNIELFERDDIAYKEANIYTKSTKSGIILLKRDYIPKKRLH